MILASSKHFDTGPLKKMTLYPSQIVFCLSFDGLEVMLQ